ncbi:MAG TPA: hypothetical protein VII93_07745, partial [Anaerolineales bacterium]
MPNNKIRSEDQHIPIGDTGRPRKPYCKPQLMQLGDLRTLTLGVSSEGFFDSGGGHLFENYFGSSAPRFPNPHVLPNPYNIPHP